MPCFHPLTGWPSRKVNPSGKRSLTFKEASGFGSPVQVPCGQCIGCRLEKARQWSVILTDEARYYEENSFLTLTYSDEHLPAGGSLDPSALQRFWKRLRARVAPKRLRHFSVGEYGDITARPHYHAICFGHAFLGDRKPFGRTKRGEPLYTSEQLSECWPYGHATIGAVNVDSCGYVARYATKKISGDKAKDHYAGRVPEFLRLSQQLGVRFFEDFKADMYPSDHRVFKVRPMRVPRKYDRMLSEEELARYKETRKAKAEQFAWNNTPDRLAVREEVTKARINPLKRDTA